MDKFTVHSGVAASLIRNNIDTDTIIPSREMKTVSKLGLSGGLFAAWRYLDEKTREPNPDFILNKPSFKNSTILISGRNFGCGSSREHAVWALKEFGFKSIIAESFGAIFYRNCIANGILPIQLQANEIMQLANEGYLGLEINLESTKIKSQSTVFDFSLAKSDRDSLLLGLDPITATLQLQQQISAFRSQDASKRPWLYNSGTLNCL